MKDLGIYESSRILSIKIFMASLRGTLLLKAKIIGTHNHNLTHDRRHFTLAVQFAMLHKVVPFAKSTLRV